MKRFGLLAIGIFSIASVLAQTYSPGTPQKTTAILQPERSMNNLPIVSEVRSFMETANGWTLQDNGKWISAENRIPFKQAEFNESSEAFYKLGRENFKLLEIRDVVVDNELYVVFIITFRTGWYEFPILMDGWHNQYALSYFVFKASKLQLVIPEKFEMDKPYIVNTEVLCDATLTEYDKNTLNSTIAYNIQKTVAYKTIAPHNLLIAVWPVQSGGQTLARFRLIQVMNRKKFYMPFLDINDRDKLFRSSYYETEYEAFRSFIQYNQGAALVQFSGTPGSAEDFYKRGMSNYAGGNYPQAIADFTEAAKYPEYSGFFLTYAYRANARQKSGDYPGAIQDFDRAVSLRPSDQSYYSAWLTTIYNRGVAKFNMKDNSGACQDWNTAIHLGFKDVATDDAVKLNCKNFPFNPSALPMTYGSSSVPGTISPDLQNDYNKVYWEGIWKYQNGNYAEALRNFNRAISLKPQSNLTSVYFYRGNCKLKLSDYQGAITDFDVASASAPSSQTDAVTMRTLYYNRGLANYFQGNGSIACSDFQKSINLGLTDSESINFIRQVCK